MKILVNLDCGVKMFKHSVLLTRINKEKLLHVIRPKCLLNTPIVPERVALCHRLCYVDFKAQEEKIQTGGTPGSKRESKCKSGVDPAEVEKAWESFAQEDQVRNAARRVLGSSHKTGSLLSLSDHKDLGVSELVERDAPPRSGGTNRKKRKDSDIWETSSSDDEGVNKPVPRKKKRKKQPTDEPDMFDSDYKGKLSSSKKQPAKLVSSGKVPTRADDDSGLGSLSEPKKSKKEKSWKESSKGTDTSDPLREELRKRREKLEKADRDRQSTRRCCFDTVPNSISLTWRR